MIIKKSDNTAMVIKKSYNTFGTRFFNPVKFTNTVIKLKEKGIFKSINKCYSINLSMTGLLMEFGSDLLDDICNNIDKTNFLYYANIDFENNPQNIPHLYNLLKIHYVHNPIEFQRFQKLHNINKSAKDLGISNSEKEKNDDVINSTISSSVLTESCKYLKLDNNDINDRKFCYYLLLYIFYKYFRDDRSAQFLSLPCNPLITIMNDPLKFTFLNMNEYNNTIFEDAFFLKLDACLIFFILDLESEFFSVYSYKQK